MFRFDFFYFGGVKLTAKVQRQPSSNSCWIMKAACKMLEGSAGKLSHGIDFVMKNAGLGLPIIENNNKATGN